MNISLDIAKTYLFSNKKMTAVATLGVVLGMSIYIFMNSMLVGFDKSSSASIFKTTPHIRIYNDDVISKPLIQDTKEKYIITNPKIVPKTNTLINPKVIIETLSKLSEVTVVTPQVATSVFFNNGKSQIAGSAIGIKPEEANIMFDIKSYMVEGNFDVLKSNSNGIIIGSGIAEKMSLGIGDNVSITSSKSVTKNLKIIGIFKTNNSKVDKTTSYVNIASAQQFLKEGTSYVTDINVNILNPEKAEKTATTISNLTGYKAEGWKEANATFMAANKMRKIIITFVSFTILIVAGFGIYNILNMTITQKINDIAILKAMGFKGKDVIRIFVSQAISIGVAGVLGGMLIATVLISILKNVYVGGDIGYFPIDYEPLKYLQGVIVGLFITFFAGYIPAKKAAKVDPVSIFRK
ncbi:Lipoprotein releasing system transmembrane protein LolC [Flavobacterium indicum GPTSA100-9 = DSM 17447]|uniref:Lipoprotein releasing system transmembrane protein LolC n=1 Tax=Flavobacterium indicum (strain DSM 17447 / CIP 109464 / GPTSA100-9) TaxID=1094466 RepID=H8XNB5_FLAIG|nr:ABC transporter permease [Flavobacterium indicum]CCG52032.1 Lipoprotein releasing system transmembrane protein LolC [Flavobacterium indicum GPTSA100-9 = DSM 17447]